MLANPDLLTQCGAFCQPDDFRSLHTLVCSGAKLPAELASNFERRFGVKILEAYDCTELSSIIATNVRDKTLEGFTQVGYKPGTVGQPLPGVSCQIAEPVTLKPLPAGQEGVLLVSGPNISPGYFRRNDLTGAARRDEWFITDDFAVMDEEGFLTIRGR
jgi:acyl-[acyl-carrier-protein]-phospholipid O-acyltransferase/long-chain-fatty-acid--[acyl-carrier-protein] ligase